MAAPTHHGESTGGGTDSTFTPTKPASTTNGDLLIIHFGWEKGTDVTPTATQWTTIDDETQGTNIGHRVAWRAEDGAALTAITLSASAKFQWTVSRISGHDSGTPVDATASANGASGNPDAAAVVTTVSDTRVYAFISAKTQTTYTAPGPYTEEYDNPNSGAGIPSNFGMSRAINSAGSENPGAATAGSASEWVASTVAIRPSTGPVAPIPFLVTAR